MAEESIIYLFKISIIDLILAIVASINSERSEVLIFHDAGHEELSSLSHCSFVSHKDPPPLVTLKSGKVWFYRLN